MSEDNNDEWDEEMLLELRRFGLEQALGFHQLKGGVDLAAVFKDADRIVNYVLGDMTP
jgi:hypothetical protein